MLGVIIGVASVVALVAVGQGATSGITKQLQGLGTNLLTVNPGSATQGFTRGAAGSATTLTHRRRDGHRQARRRRRRGARDLDAGPGGRRVARTPRPPSWGPRLSTCTVRNYTHVAGLVPQRGGRGCGPCARRCWARPRRTTWASMPSAIGTTSRSTGCRSRSSGILQAKGSVGPVSSDDQVLVPISAVQHYYDSTTKVRSIGISVTDGRPHRPGEGRDQEPAGAAPRHRRRRHGRLHASPTRRSCWARWTRSARC